MTHMTDQEKADRAEAYAAGQAAYKAGHAEGLRLPQRLYRVEMTIAATAYIKAGTASQAAEQARALRGRALEVEDNGGEVAISGMAYDNPDLPEVSLSPAMTIIGARGVEEVD